MKKTIYLIAALILSGTVLSLSSCLKDSSYVDLGKGAPIVNFPLGGSQYYGADAITEMPDTDANGTIVRQFAVNVAAPKVKSTPTQVTLAVDNSIVTSYDAANPSVDFLPMPSDAYVFTSTTLTVPAGQQYAITSVTFYKNKLDPSKSYMLPIRIVSAGGLAISANQNIHYYHFIGNDFAGAWRQTFRRWNASDSTSAPLNGASFSNQPVTFFPVSPTEFTVKSGYAGNLVSYDVSFVKNADGTYSNFAVKILPSDIAVLTMNGISLAQDAVFLPSQPSAASYTFAQASTLFHFQWVAKTSSNRYLVDQYYK